MNTRDLIRSWILPVLLITPLFVTPSAHAKVFQNAYVSFELPPVWNCVLEGTEWVCRSAKPGDSREAIIILTAKEAGPVDTMPFYLQHLRQAKSLVNRGGQPMQSQVVNAGQRIIANQPWIDGLQLGSEIPNYYTRYMATVKNNVGILVTFSAHKRVYTKYSNDFFRAIQSLRVLVTKDLATGPGSGLRPSNEMLGQNIGGVVPDDMMQEPDEGAAPRRSGTSNMFFGIAILMAAAGIYLFIKNKRES